MRSYCTLFDKNYLFQGIALHNSLRLHAKDCVLYALCMDITAYKMISAFNRDGLIPISIEDLITEEVAIVRERTTHGQFCWVCQPLVCQYILKKFDVDMVTYLESDSMFFSDPEVLFDELGESSVSIIPHNFTPRYDNTADSGKYCVQFNAFKNNAEAHEVLDYWKACCFQYTKEKPLVYPGQTCLDDWPVRFNCVKLLQHPGAGVAPWNIQRYELESKDSGPFVDGFPVIFYHYHEYGRYQDGSHELGNYPLSKLVVELFYKPYVLGIDAAVKEVHDIDPTFNYRRYHIKCKSLLELTQSPATMNFKSYLAHLNRKIRGVCNIYPDRFFSRDLEVKVRPK